MEFRIDLVLVAVISGLFGLMTQWLIWKLSILKSQKEKDKEVDLIDQTLNAESQVKENLKDLLLKMKADRVSIYQFHNGERYYESCNHMKRISKNAEVCNIGITEDILTQQNMPVSLFIDSIKSIMKDGYASISDIYTIKDHSFKDFLVKKGILSIYGFGIFSLNHKKLIGILTIVYIKNYYEMNDDEIDECVLDANKLAGFLI